MTALSRGLMLHTFPPPPPTPTALSLHLQPVQHQKRARAAHHQAEGSHRGRGNLLVICILFAFQSQVESIFQLLGLPSGAGASPDLANVWSGRWDRAEGDGLGTAAQGNGDM